MIFLYAGAALVSAVIVLLSMLALKVGQARRASRKRGCAYCGSPAMHVSSPGGLPGSLIDKLLTHWNCAPHRCEVCFHRQYRLADRPGSDD